MASSPSSRLPPVDPHRLFKYPPMERQDLNQSQLGSFKFTPVDSAQSIHEAAARSLTHSLAAYLIQSPCSPSHPTQFSLSRSSSASPSTDLTFFNNHIKPDLADSRLRLGPAAFRSAVEHASASPTRKGCYPLSQNFPNSFNTSQPNFLPSTSITPGRVLHHQVHPLSHSRFLL